MVLILNTSLICLLVSPAGAIYLQQLVTLIETGHYILVLNAYIFRFMNVC
jgi:hypothetical protein